MIGSTISHYRILEKLGEGGMGVVYKAEDTKLDRPVALKLLPAHLLGNEDIRKRFEREAKSSAALSHPNVCTVHEIDEADGQTFIAMELIEGESLDKKIVSGPLKLDEALSIAQQVAKGLEAAHSCGIVHRDIKPENIMVGEDGHVTIMDFGLAQLAEVSRLTKTDETVGTVAYMSPEQTEGSGTDHRTDIWSLGVVLYEMITGQQPFKGDYNQAVMYSILNEEPEPPTALRTGVPIELEFVVKKCLDKHASGRFQSAQDLSIDLARQVDSQKFLRSAPAKTIRSDHALRPTETPLRRTALIAATASLLAAALTWMVAAPDRPAASRAVKRLSVEHEPIETLGVWRPDDASGMVNNTGGELARSVVAITPDGEELVIAGRAGDQVGLFLRPLHRDVAEFIDGTEGAMAPFLSPDGVWVGFWSAGVLKKVRLSGGPVVPLCKAELPFGATWGPSGRIVFADQLGSLWSVAEEGGQPEQLLRESASARERRRLPWFLPGGDALLYTVFDGWAGGSWEQAKIVAQRIDGSEPTALVTGGSNPKYSPTGHILFAKQGALWAAPFDPDRLEITGAVQLVLEDLTHAAGISHFAMNTGAAQYDFSSRGDLVYLSGGLLPAEPRKLVWFDRKGAREPVEGVPSGEYWHPRISPGGDRVAVSDQFSDTVIVHDLRSGISQRLRGNGVNVGAWSPDERHVLFGWTDSGARNLFRQLVDGSENAESITTGAHLQFAGPWIEPDSHLIFVERRPETGRDLLRLRPPQPGGQVEVILAEPFDEQYPAVSPGGGRLAYSSDESEQDEVYIRSYPGLTQKRIVSSDGGFMPAWDPNGRTLYYLRSLGDMNQTMAMMAVDVDQPEVGARELFRGPFQVSGYIRTYDVDPDGRFLMVERGAVDRGAGRMLRLILNWSDLLAE